MADSKYLERFMFNGLVHELPFVSEEKIREELDGDEEKIAAELAAQKRVIMFTYSVNRKLYTAEIVLTQDGLIIRLLDCQIFATEEEGKIRLVTISNSGVSEKITGDNIAYYFITNFKSEDKKAEVANFKSGYTLQLQLTEVDEFHAIFRDDKAKDVAEFALAFLQNCIERLDNEKK